MDTIPWNYMATLPAYRLRCLSCVALILASGCDLGENLKPVLSFSLGNQRHVGKLSEAELSLEGRQDPVSFPPFLSQKCERPDAACVPAVSHPVT